MHDTPFFPAWRHRFTSRVKATLTRLGHCTLDQLEARLHGFMPGVSEITLAGASARERPFSVRRTFWGFLWQSLHVGASCREVVRQAQAALVLGGRPSVDSGTSAYCQARARLPLAVLERLLCLSAQAADHAGLASATLQGRTLKIMDGTTLALPDTPANQAGYPQPSTQKPGCGFPLLHALVVQSAHGGGILDHAIGDRRHSEMRLLHTAISRLQPKDIVLYDRAAGHYVACALLRAREADLISRVALRRIDWRKGRRIGPNERLVTWEKSRQRPAYLTPAEWAPLPMTILVRVLRVRVEQPGYRTRTLSLVTTLLDPAAYPFAQIAAAYLRRWRVEMGLDDLKTTLDLEHLRCQSPAMIQRELLCRLILHNLVRAVMAEAAAEHHVPLDQLSFKGALDSLRTFSSAFPQALLRRQRLALWDELLRVIADDLIPWRPNRWEPRAVKRRPKSFPPLTRPRHSFRQLRHGAFFCPSKKT